MADDPTIDNGSLTDYKVRATETAGGEFIQHVRIDVGSGSAESVAAGALPITGTVTANIGTVAGLATAANQLPDGHNVTISGSATVSGTVTANAGTNLNTSALALESGGNLAAIAGKDFATQTTLAALNAKVTAVNTGAVTISAALPAGTNNIGDVDVLTLPTLNVNNVSGTVSLPTDAATETTLAALNAKVTACDTGNVTVSSLPDVVVLPKTLTTSGSITANGQSVSLAVTDYSNVAFTISGTYATVNISFQGSIDGGTTYFAITAIRSDANTIETTSGSLSNATRCWETSVNGYTHFRVLTTAFGSGTAAIIIHATSIGSEPIPGIATHAVTQSGTWNVGTVTTLTNITNQGQIVDNAGFTDGTTRLNMAGFIFDEVAGTALTENDGIAARVDSKRAQVLVLEDATTRGRRATVSATGALSVDAAVTAFSTIGTGSTNVTTAGTRVVLAGSTACKKVVICAKAANTGTIWVGGSTVASGSGIPLVALQQIEIDIQNLTTVNIDSTVNGEGVTYLYYN